MQHQAMTRPCARTRANQLNVYLDDDEHTMLRELVKFTGLSSQSEVIRQLIRKGHHEQRTPAAHARRKAHRRQ